MARFKADDADKYGGQGGGGFFQINKDKGVKQVRFLYNSVDDIDGMSVHKIKIDGKDRYVNCLREYNDPLDTCPFCRERIPVQARLLIPLYNIDDGEVQIWDRGKSMFENLIGVCRRATKKGGTIVSHIFEVERHGKPNDKKTEYQIFDTDEDETELSEFELPKVLGGLVLDKTADDMEYFLENMDEKRNGDFPPSDDEEDEEPVRRRGSRREEPEDDAEDEEEEAPRSRGSRERTERSSRRTPARSGKTKEEEF
jgi:hypothetical protein